MLLTDQLGETGVKCHPRGNVLWVSTTAGGLVRYNLRFRRVRHNFRLSRVGEQLWFRRKSDDFWLSGERDDLRLRLVDFLLGVCGGE